MYKVCDKVKQIVDTNLYQIWTNTKPTKLNMGLQFTNDIPEPLMVKS